MHFDNESDWTVGTLCVQLLQFHANSLKTLHVLWTWSEDMHEVWMLSSDYFLSFFSQFELRHFFRHFSEWIEGTFCAQLLQFNINTFETLQTL